MAAVSSVAAKRVAFRRLASIRTLLVSSSSATVIAAMAAAAPASAQTCTGNVCDGNEVFEADLGSAETSGIPAFPDGGDGPATWGQAYGAWGQTDGDGNAGRLERSGGGFFFGVDAPAFDAWRVGAVGGYGSARFTVGDRFSSGSSDNYHLGLYGGAAWGDLALRMGAAYTWHAIDTRRAVAIPGLSDSLSAGYSAATTQIFGEFGYGIETEGVALESFVSLAYVNLHVDGWAEAGGAAALNGRSSGVDMGFTTLGLRASTVLDLNGTRLTAKGMLGWRRALGDGAPDATMRFAAGDDAFSIAGAPVARDAAIVEAGVDYALSLAATLGASCAGQFGDGATDQSFRASFSVKF